MENAAALSKAEVCTHVLELKKRDELIESKDLLLKLLRSEHREALDSKQQQENLLRARDVEVDSVKIDLQKAHDSSKKQEELLQSMRAELKSVRAQLRDALELGDVKR